MNKKSVFSHQTTKDQKFNHEEKNKNSYKWEECKKRAHKKRNRVRCKLCNLPTDTLPLCKNCEISLFQIRELKINIQNSLKRGKHPPNWALKASEKIVDILSDYPEFAAYKNVISELVWKTISDNEVSIRGLDLDNMASLRYTSKSKETILRVLYELDIIYLSNDRKVFPGNILQHLLDLKKIYGDNFASINWKKYTSAIQIIFILDITEKKIKDYLIDRSRLPKQVLLIFKILSRVIQGYMNKNPKENRLIDFWVPEHTLIMVLNMLSNEKVKNNFYCNITGIKDGNSKLIADFSDKKREFKIHDYFVDYLKHMIERLREEEREREDR